MRDDQFTQILRAINDVRDDVKEFKHEMNKRWDENEKRWDENDKRWEKNERRWEENESRWEENESRWEENESRWEENYKHWEDNDKKLILIQEELGERIEQRYRDTIKIFDRYESSIENMYQENKQKIINIQKRLKIANA